MTNTADINIDEETITKVGLIPSANSVNAQLAQNGRVFEYPQLDQVYVMESDLYGNSMPKGSCFLAFYGRNGLVGKDLKIETLKNSSVEEIKAIVESNSQG